MSIVNRILESKTANFLNRANVDVLNELIEVTSFLPVGHSVAIRYWYIKNQKDSIVKCVCCTEEPKFHGNSKGYSLYCSTKCRNIDTKNRHLKNYQEKIKNDENLLIREPDNFIKCEICNSAVRLIKNHLLNSHKDWTYERYKKEYPNSKDVSVSTIKKISDNNIGQNNIFSKTKSTESERKSRSIFSLEYWKLKYPEKSEEDLIELRNMELKDKLKDRLLPNQVEYWINKGFTEEESIEKVKERQRTFTLEKCIEKYGEVEGAKKFNERQKKWTDSLNKNFEKYGDGRSPQSKWSSDIIDFLCKELRIERPRKEKWISNETLRCSYDFTFGKKIIEFNGDYWHMNPEIYESEDFNKRMNMSAQEKWNIDKEKIKLAELHGYSVLVVWESDYNKNKKEIINICLEFLNS